MKYIYNIIIFWLISINCFAQTTFTLANNQTGILHLYFNIPSEMGSGVAFFNLNGDSYQDLVFTGGDGDDIVYKNLGNGVFEQLQSTGITKPINDRSLGVIAGDIDNDGDDDILILMEEDLPNRLYLNNGDETFTDISVSSGIDRIFDGSIEDQQSFSAAMGDVNQDGFLDIYVSNWIDELGFIFDSITHDLTGFAHTGGANRLYINQGDLTFLEESDKYGVGDEGCALATVFSDPDNDQDVDILTANDFGMWVIPDAYYQNQYPLDTFYNLSSVSGFDSQLYGMGVGVGDYDQDGDLDYYKTNIGRNVLLNNLGNNQFQDTTAFAGVEDEFVTGQPPHLASGWGAGFVDIDNDSYLDLIVANGRIGNAGFFPAADSMPDRLYKNLGNGTFTDIASSSNFLDYGMSRGVAYGDIDNDGDMDVILTNVSHLNLSIPAYPVVFRNDFQDSNRNWLKVQLEGTTINRNAIGSHIIIYVGGKSWIHEINSGGQGHTSQHSRIAHFGLDNATMVDSLIVKWSNSNIPDQVYTNISANKMIKITEGQTNYDILHGPVSTKPLTTNLKQVNIFPNPVQDQLNIELELTKKENVTIQILNGLGQVIKQFPTQQLTAGTHQLRWDVTTGNGTRVSTGLYYVVIQTETGRLIEKIISIK